MVHKADVGSTGPVQEGRQKFCFLLLMRNPKSPQDPLNRLRFRREEIDEVLESAVIHRL